jgi:hypothetical protein
MLGAGVLRHIFPDVQREVFVESHRDRVRLAFETMRQLAAEASERPRFVFVHVMAPHPPYVFGPTGENIEAQPCFPVGCDLWNGVYRYGDELWPSFRDQLRYINALVADTTRDVAAASEREAVIIVMSDHGHRHDLDDPAEMLRALFLSRTPSHPVLFPASSTPVNVFPRLLNAYFDANLELDEEPTDWVDLRTLDTVGIMDPVPVLDVR